MTVGIPGGPNRDLALLVAGNGVSTLGNAVYLIAVTLLLKDLTGSAAVLGLFQFLALAPGFLLSPVTGVIIDRTSRRRVVILSDLLRGLLMVGAGAALLVPAWRTPWLILPVSFAAGVGHAFFVPAAQALLPDLVPPERLHAANGVRATVSQLANLTGNALGGLLYAVVGAPFLFVLNGVTFLLSAWQERFIRGGRDARGGGAATGSFLRAAGEGLAVLTGRGELRRLIVSQAGLFLISPVLMLSLPFVVIDELGLGPRWVGFFFAAALAGGIIAFLALYRRSAGSMLRAPLPAAAYLALALAFIAPAIRISTPVLFLVALVTGAAAGIVYLFAVTWIQNRTQPELHGRLFALLEAASSLVAPVSYLVSGLVLEGLGPERRWLLFGGVGLLALAWSGRLWWSYLRGEETREG
jgi:MFS transporter, DHA3 family, macrolide efflux protein